VDFQGLVKTLGIAAAVPNVAPVAPVEPHKEGEVVGPRFGGRRLIELDLRVQVVVHLRGDGPLQNERALRGHRIGDDLGTPRMRRVRLLPRLREERRLRSPLAVGTGFGVVTEKAASQVLRGRRSAKSDRDEQG